MYKSMLFKTHIVFIVFFITSVDLLANVSYIARWRDNAKGALSLTIDDNGAGTNRKEMAAILQEYGVRGTFCVITAYMNNEMFLDIFRQGHELASHSKTHPSLLDLKSILSSDEYMDKIISELLDSKNQIWDLTKEPCVSFAAPYGYLALAPEVTSVAQQYYISARGVQRNVNCTIGLPANMYNLGIGPFSPYFTDDETTNWDNAYYVNELIKYNNDIIQLGGWGIVMFHNLIYRPEDNNGGMVTETALRSYLSNLKQDFASKLWVAPQGKVARYCIERDNSTIATRALSNKVILIDFSYPGDTSIINEPLTIITQIPRYLKKGDLKITQKSRILYYSIGNYDIVSDPVESIRISGDMSPDVRGIYLKLPGGYNEKPAYKARDKDFYIWYNKDNPCYYLSSVLGQSGDACWFSIRASTPISDYSVDGSQNPGVTGTPKAYIVPQQVFGVKYDILPEKTSTIRIESKRQLLDFKSIAIQIQLSGSQKKLLQSKVLATYLEPKLERALSAILSEKNKYYLYLDPMDLKNLIDTISFVSNHEKYNLKLVKQLDQLADDMGKFLDKE